MTITASPLSITRRNAAVSASAWFHTTDPGVFVCIYPAGITGPPTVRTPEEWEREWRNGLKHGQYLARDGASTASRLGVSFCLEIDQSVLQQSVAAGANAFTVAMIASNLRTDVARRINWKFVLHLYRSANNTVNYRFAYVQSASSSSAEAVYLGPDNALAAPATDRYIVTLPADTGVDGNVYFYNTTGTSADVTRARGATSGTMGGTEAVVINLPCKISKFDRMLNQSDREGFCQSGTLPASPSWSIQGGHEINPAAPVFYDTSGNGLDLSDVDVQYWPEAAASGDSTDTGFTSPLVEVPITIAADCTAGVHDITLRRTRVGIPVRTPALSDAVLYDDGTIPVTVAVTAEAVAIGPDVDCQVPSYPAAFDLQLCGNYDGAATVVSDDPNLVPASPVTITGGVATVACTVAADVTGATVTATGPGGDTDACSVTVAEVPEEIVPIKIGPSQTLRSGVTSIYLHITGEDGACTVTALPVVGLSGVPATVTISSGEADLTLTKMSAGTYTITATQGAMSDTCTITVPVGFAAATEYDLVQDIADMIETYGVGYHYDPELLTDTGGDLEDRMFTVRETGVVDGPMIGGKTVTIAVDAYYCNRAPSSDAKALIDYLNCEADAPSYVHALFATGGQVSDFEGAQKITYEIQVSLG